VRSQELVEDQRERDRGTVIHLEVNGYPLKLRIPTKLGFKNPKWITAIFVTNRFPGGFWEDRGYSWFAGRTLLSGHCFRRSCRRRGRPPLRPDMIFGRDTVKWDCRF